MQRIMPFSGALAAVGAMIGSAFGAEPQALDMPLGGVHPMNPRTPPFGSSKRTVAQDQRRAKKARAVKRARRLGHS